LITVVGAGGVGGWLVHGLAPFLIDKEELRVIDFDIVEDKNLERQTLFTKDDVGKKKVEALTSHHVITPLDMKIDEENATAVLEDSDVVFLAVDNHYARMCVLTAMLTESWSGLMVNGSNEFDTASAWVTGQDLPFIGDRYPDLMDADPPVERMSCGQIVASAPQVIHANQMAASLAIWLWRFWKFTAPYIESDMPWQDRAPVEYRAARSGIKTVTREEAEELCLAK
jgi:molybdopterin/thiamine biosynthesis adenylyltransferase